MKISKSVHVRFWKYVQKKAHHDCWIWIGSLTVRGGYGQLNDKGKLLKAHRLSFQIHNGHIPKGLFICHRCNVPACCNPQHLYAGTAKQNWDDTIDAGTRFVPNGAKGEKHHDAKLNIKQVKYILASSETGVGLAKKFGVTPQSISRIRKGLSWKNIRSQNSHPIK